ncbi:MAG TPA: hypothetical protein VGJ81_20595 [Thermoanaerobaculia bacterium]|jgi:hypothetical protein
MTERRLGLLAGVALIAAQICCAPPIQAAPSSSCPLKFHGGCPLQRQNSCSATAPQRSTAIRPKPVAANIALPQATRQIAPIVMAYLLAVAPPALERNPLTLVLRI